MTRTHFGLTSAQTQGATPGRSLRSVQGPLTWHSERHPPLLGVPPILTHPGAF